MREVERLGYEVVVGVHILINSEMYIMNDNSSNLCCLITAEEIGWFTPRHNSFFKFIFLLNYH